jgi:hypothetical protein
MTGVCFPIEVVHIVHTASGATQPLIEHVPGVKRPEHKHVDLETYSSYYNWKRESGET